MRLYPFIDIAVLPEVRESFAAGRALVVLHGESDDVLWVNGPGAAFFGVASIEDMIGEQVPLSALARRQLRSAAGSHQRRPLLLRMDRGLDSRQIPVHAQRIVLPDGDHATLMIGPESGEEAALGGFSDENAVAVLLDRSGRQIVADERIQAIDPSPEDLLLMRQQLERQGLPSIKLRIRTSHGLVPAALGDLKGDPQRFILFMFIEPESAAEPEVSSPDERPHMFRFVWETDADGRFIAVSDSLKQAIGLTGQIEGRGFPDVMAQLGLDPDGRLTALMAQQDTWSGRSVAWPIAGTDRALPADLAALPLFDRERRFIGYRGYGVAYPDRIATDPASRGLAFESGWPEDGDVSGSDDVSQSDEHALQDASIPEDMAEPPVVTPSPLRRRSDRLAASGAERKSLTDAESLAFRTIGERLRLDTGNQRTAVAEDASAAPLPRETALEGAPENQPIEPVSKEGDEQPKSTDELPETEAEIVEAEAAPAQEDAPRPPVPDEGDEDARLAIEAKGWRRSNALAPSIRSRLASEAASSQDTSGETAPEDSANTGQGSASDAVDNAEADRDRQFERIKAANDAGRLPEGVSPAFSDTELLKPKDGIATPRLRREETRLADEEEAPPANDDQETHLAAARRSTNLTPSALAFLPLPFLVLDRGSIAYASRSLLDLTGYHSVGDIEAAGGFGSFFDGPAPADAKIGKRRAMLISAAHGESILVETQMQAIGWSGESALLFAFTPLEKSERGTDDEAAPPATGTSEEAVMPASEATELLTREESDQLLAEIAEPLRRHIEELTMILDTATDGVVLLTPDGAVRSTNRSGEALFGEDSAALQGRPFRQLFAFESRLTIDNYLASLRESGRASVLNDGREVIGKEKSGGFIPLFINLGKLPANSGYCVVLRDITHWKRVENELRQARRAAEDASVQKTEFLARVSHEVRTPLNAIIGFSELMISERFGPVGNPRYRDYLRDIQKSGSHVLDLVNDLLDISKIEGGHQELQFEAVGLNEVVIEVVNMLQPQANSERVIIRTSLASSLPDVVADPRSMKQVAINLLTNAVKFTAAGGQIIASTARNRDGTVSLRIRDSGIGMSQEDISQALMPFKQISTLHRSRRDGTGLGLPLTKALVEANKARFMIESEPNVGTLVEVFFPGSRVLN